MSMFNDLEKEKLKILIDLYEKYISGDDMDKYEKDIDSVSFDSGFEVFSKIVNLSGWKTEAMIEKKLPRKEAGKILKKLKSLQKEAPSN